MRQSSAGRMILCSCREHEECRVEFMCAMALNVERR